MLKNKYGLILTETLLSIAMIAIAVVVLGAIFTSASFTTRLSKNYLLAQNLATEAIEGVKNLRDTNWLVEPTRRECWLSLDPKQVCGKMVEEESNYKILKNSGEQWILEWVKGELTLEEIGGYEEYRLYIENVEDVYNRYVHDGKYFEPSPYYRSIKFIKLDADSATFEVKVQWLEGPDVRTILRRVTIYNYLL